MEEKKAKGEEKGQLTLDQVAIALIALPKTLTYRLGDSTKTYSLRITADQNGFNAYYWHDDITSFSVDKSIYDTKGEQIEKVVVELNEKLRRTGDINQKLKMPKRCEGCPNETDTCVKVYNPDNTTTCINYCQK